LFGGGDNGSSSQGPTDHVEEVCETCPDITSCKSKHGSGSRQSTFTQRRSTFFFFFFFFGEKDKLVGDGADGDFGGHGITVNVLIKQCGGSLDELVVNRLVDKDALWKVQQKSVGP
jgi:hypothetical protein